MAFVENWRRIDKSGEKTGFHDSTERRMVWYGYVDIAPLGLTDVFDDQTLIQCARHNEAMLEDFSRGNGRQLAEAFREEYLPDARSFDQDSDEPK